MEEETPCELAKVFSPVQSAGKGWYSTVVKLPTLGICLEVCVLPNVPGGYEWKIAAPDSV